VADKEVKENHRRDENGDNQRDVSAARNTAPLRFSATACLPTPLRSYAHRVQPFIASHFNRTCLHCTLLPCTRIAFARMQRCFFRRCFAASRILHRYAARAPHLSGENEGVIEKVSKAKESEA